MKVKRKEGDRAFEVEWCDHIPVFEDGCHDMDNAHFNCLFFKTKKKALEFAKRILPKDKFGAVMITPVEWRDQYPNTLFKGWLFEWEYIGESEEFTG